jgi:hypothetical protein
MSWRDGGFTIPSLEERQHTMVIRTILDMMSTSDKTLLKIMRQFEKEEAAVYGCTIQERQQEGGSFLRWEGPLPDLRSSSRPVSGYIDAPQPEGDAKMHPTLLQDLSIFPGALKAMQELGLSIWMNDVTPCLRHVKLNVDFSKSKITRPAMWITQEVVRKLAFFSFHNAAQSSVGSKEFENKPTANHFLNWATSRYDDSLLKFAVGARLYTLRTPAVNRRDFPDTGDIPCPMCSEKMNPDLHHILSECKHGGPATMIDRHNRVACAVRKAIEIWNPQAKIMEDKTALSFCADLAPGLRRLRPDLMFESAIEKTVCNKKIVENTIYLVEIATPWTCEGTNGSTLKIAYDKKVTKYQPLIADIERKKPGYKCIQATIIVSPTGAFYRQPQDEFAKVSKLARGNHAVHKRCIVDACVQGAYEQWRQFGHKLRLAAQLESINPGASPRLNVADR